MWDVKACRGCLSVKGKLEKIGDASKRVYSALTDLSITDCDGYPNYFCLECRTQIKKCLAFRRKTRRAHFVLKEIMSVRKQVTYSDIVTVNRKKTNLESSLNFWDPQRSGYVVINPDGEVEDSVKTEAMRTYSTCVVDIKPSIETIEAALKVEEPPDEILDLPDNDDITNDFNDTAESEEPIPDIDLNDVFKDLNEDKSDNETVVNEAIKKKRKRVDNEEEDVLMKMLSCYSRKSILEALELYTITVLDLEQQKIRMDLRRSQAPFAHALYKCSMCLTVHEDMPKLVEHVAYHNKRRLGHECVVCKNKYPTVEQLNMHVAQFHMYEYKCKCGQTFYCLYEAVKHSKTYNILHLKEATEKSMFVAAALQTFTLTALSQKMMSEVLALKSGSDLALAAAQPKAPSDKFKCDICGVWTASFRNLEKHMVLRHKYLYTCNECKEVFTMRLQAIEHAATHKYEYCRCENCGIKFKNERKLKLHRCTAQKLIPCNLCGLSFKRHCLYKHQLTEHKYISLNDPLVGDPSYTCSDCGVQFVDKRSCETHLVITNHAGANDVEFACVPCKKLFDDEEQMETHFVTCGKNKKYPRKCCYCEEVLKDNVQYKQHYFYQHPTLQYRYTKMNAICELCGRMVKKYQLDAHLRMHECSAYECRHCGLASAAPAAHVAHVLAAHAARPYRCTLCARRFQHRSDCKDHVLKVHAPTKLYKCEFCGLEFSYFKHLRDHSESQHNLIIPTMKGTSKKSKSKIFVYAHMIIEINEKEREAVEKTEVAMLDYLDQKSKTVDYKDFFRFITDPDEYIVRIHKRLRKKKKSRAKVKIESDVVIKPGETENAVEQIKREVEEPVMEIEIKLKDEVETAVQEIETYNSEVLAEPQAMEVDEGNPLEVFENEGGQYVMIGGELYRIACDDEE